MKKTFTFEAESRTAFFISCPRCHGVHTAMMRQIKPETELPYHVECKKCHLEADDKATEAGAEAAWVELVATYDGEEWHGEA